MPTTKSQHLADQQTTLIHLFNIDRVTQTPPLCSGNLHTAQPCPTHLPVKSLTRAKTELNHLIKSPTPSRESYGVLQDLSGVVLCKPCVAAEGESKVQEMLERLGEHFGRDGGGVEKSVEEMWEVLLAKG